MSRFLILILSLSSTQFIQAQDTPPVSIIFNHISLSVKDVNRSADFYKSVLQLKEITNRTEVEGIRWFSLGDNLELHLISTLKDPVTINKAVHFAVSTPDFTQFVKQLDKMHIDYSDWPGSRHKITTRADGIRQIYIQDPDGYWIEVNSVGKSN